MAHAPALLRTNTAPVFPANSNYGGTTSSSMSSFRVSHLSGATAVNSASTTSLSSMSSANTMIPSANGVMATANIINQRADASRSLYQICMALKQRLAQVPDFQGYLQILDDDAIRSSNNYDPVESLWKLFRTGDPLLTIYNSIKPDIPLNPADLPMDPARRPKAATFQFINACLKQLQIPAGDCFIVSDLMNTDTTGFMKLAQPNLTCNQVIQVINHVLDLAEQRGYLIQLQPYPEDNGPEAPTYQMTHRDHIIRELVDTERKYVQDLENLHDLRKCLLEKEVIPQYVAHNIFLNLNSILDFQRRFLIRIETTNSMPQAAQQWGSPFVTFEGQFSIYQNFITNQRKAAKTANQVFDKIQLAEHPVACDFNTLDGFLLKPMQRLVKYPLLLKDLLKSCDDPDAKIDLSDGIKAAERVLHNANEAVNRDLLDEALEELKVRVDDWKNHKVDHFGSLLLHGVYTVVTGRTEQEKDYEIYLFESILLCCKEVLPSKSKEKKDKNKSIHKVRNKNNKLQLKGRIFMTNVTEVLSFAKPGSYTVQIWWKGDPAVENFTIKFTNEETMKKWASSLDVQRKQNIQPVMSPEKSAVDFIWTRDAKLENPYQGQGGDDEEDEASVSGQVSSPNMGYSLNAGGGVMGRDTPSGTLRARSVTNDSSLSLASLARAPPQLPLPPPPATQRQLSVQTQGNAQSPGQRIDEPSYFSPTESPVSSRASMASTLLNISGQYPFPRTSTPQGGWEDRDNNRHTAPVGPRAPSRDGATPVNGRNPRGPSLPVMASQQTLAQQQRSRSYSTPDINGQGLRRATSNTPVPAVPGIPPHLHPAHDSNIPRSQTGSPRLDIPIRANTQSPGVQRDRLNQQGGSYGGTMAQFPTQPAYPRQAPPSSGLTIPGSATPQPLNVDGRQGVLPGVGSASGHSYASQDLPIPTQIRVKVNCDTGTYVTLVVPFNITYQSLIDRIDVKLARFTNSSIGKGNLRLRYRDEDEDLVTIESDDDIQIAFQEWREGVSYISNNGGLGEIELFCDGEMS